MYKLREGCLGLLGRSGGLGSIMSSNLSPCNVKKIISSAMLIADNLEHQISDTVCCLCLMIDSFQP